MDKIIIDNKSSLADDVAIKKVADIISAGKISNFGKQYCYLTIYHDDDNTNEYKIACFVNKKSYRFVIF